MKDRVTRDGVTPRGTIKNNNTEPAPWRHTVLPGGRSAASLAPGSQRRRRSNPPPTPGDEHRVHSPAAGDPPAPGSAAAAGT